VLLTLSSNDNDKLKFVGHQSAFQLRGFGL
jgi:hypothetical protein